MKKLPVAIALIAATAIPGISSACAACGGAHHQFTYTAAYTRPAAPVCQPAPAPVCQPVYRAPACRPVCDPCDPCRRSGLFGLGILGIL